MCSTTLVTFQQKPFWSVVRYKTGTLFSYPDPSAILYGTEEGESNACSERWCEEWGGGGGGGNVVAIDSASVGGDLLGMRA